MLTTKQFKLVKTIIDHGSLQQASYFLHLSQSALSHQLKKLEDEIQTQLFERSAYGLKVTEAGKVIYKYALRIEDELSSIHQEIADIKSKQHYQYTHGYSDFEANRLLDQANTVADFIHNDSYWPADSVILEVGCGIGAQSKIIAQQNPDCTFISIDISEESILTAQANDTLQQLDNISFRVLDAYQIGELNRQFDHIFLCFVLEHVTNPSYLLKSLKKHLKPGGSITLIEGDHGSTYFFPESTYASKSVFGRLN